MTVRFTPRARDDLREILDYIAKENPTAADRVARAIFDTTALIAARPHLGIRNAKATSAADLKSLHRLPQVHPRDFRSKSGTRIKSLLVPVTFRSS
jgi:plasmid stabilization system protein ParE